MRALLPILAALLLALPADAQRRIDDFGRGAFANRPTCTGDRDGERYRVTDAADSTCAAGGGSTRCTLVCQDGTWAKLGTGGGGGTDDQTAAEVPFTPNGSIAATNTQAAIQEVRDEAQPLDSDLTAIAALTTTAFGRGLLDDADAAAGRLSLDLGAFARLAPNAPADLNSITESGVYYAAVGTTNAPTAGEAYLVYALRGGPGDLMHAHIAVNFVTGMSYSRGGLTGSLTAWQKSSPTLGAVDDVQLSDGAGGHKEGPLISSLLLKTEIDTFAEWEALLADLTGTANNTTFLRGDGAWETPAGGSSVSVDGTSVTDPDFRSEGTVDFIRCTAASTPDARCLAAGDILADSERQVDTSIYLTVGPWLSGDCVAFAGDHTACTETRTSYRSGSAFTVVGARALPLSATTGVRCDVTLSVLTPTTLPGAGAPNATVLTVGGTDSDGLGEVTPWVSWNAAISAGGGFQLVLTDGTGGSCNTDHILEVRFSR